MRKLIFDILSNPDGKTYSSKRVGGFISLFATIGFGGYDLIQAMTITAGLVVAFFGLATIDYKEFMKNETAITKKETAVVEQVTAVINNTEI